MEVKEMPGNKPPRRSFFVTGLDSEPPAAAFVKILEHRDIPKLNSSTWDEAPGWKLVRQQVKPLGRNRAEVTAFYESPAE